MINFSGARVLGYDHSHLFLGDNFRYATRKNLSIEGSIYALTNTSGVAPIWVGISGLISSANDYSDVIINGVNFGPGRVEGVSFTESIDITKKDYRASIVTFDSGNLFNLGPDYYSGLNLNDSANPIYLAESFNEDFSFSTDEDNIGEWIQNVNVKFVSGAANSGNGNPIEMAKRFASGLMYRSPGFQVFAPTYQNGYASSGHRFFKESYNQITNECSFSSSQKIPTGVSTYTFVYTHSVNTDQDGITSVEENGKIAGIADNRYTNAQIGYSNEFPFAFSRSSEVFNAYAPAQAGALSSNKISLSRQDNKFEGTIDFSVLFNNDPRNNNFYSWEYTQEISKEDNCNYKVSEKGKIKGISTTCSQTNAYLNALNGYDAVKAGLLSRVNTFYQQAAARSKSLKMLSKSEAKSAFDFSVEYESVFSDDPNENIDGYKKIDYSIEDSYPVARIAKFNILGVKEIVQPQQSSTPGNRSISLRMQGYKTDTLSKYQTYAQSFLNSNKPTAAGDTFLDNCKYEWSPTNATFSIEASWTFFGSRSFSNVTL